MQHAGEQVGGYLRTYNDGGLTNTQGEEEGKSGVWGLWKGDGSGITLFPPHDSARKGKGEKMGMDGRGHGGGGAENVPDGIPQGGGQRTAQSKGAWVGRGRGRQCACTSGEGTCGTQSSSWRRETSATPGVRTVTCCCHGGPLMDATRAQRCVRVEWNGNVGG